MFELLIAYQAKHWICDYPLQGRYMLGKFGKWPSWVLPLLSHSVVHGIATYVIAYCVKPDIAIWCALFDTSVHFLVDRLKASPDLGGRFKPLTKKEFIYQDEQLKTALSILAKNPAFDSVNFQGATEIKEACERNFRGNTFFWWLLGLDQMAHHLTHYVIIYALVR